MLAGQAPPTAHNAPKASHQASFYPMSPDSGPPSGLREHSVDALQGVAIGCTRPGRGPHLSSAAVLGLVAFSRSGR